LQLLADLDITQLDTNTPALSYKQTKGLLGKHDDKMT
jgi:hypothetical protein